MAPGGETVREAPRIGFEAPREGRGDRMAEMGKERDPHAVTGAGDFAAAPASVRASMARITDAELV